MRIHMHTVVTKQWCVLYNLYIKTTDIFSFDTFGLLIDINTCSRNGEPFRLAEGFYVQA